MKSSSVLRGEFEWFKRGEKITVNGKLKSHHSFNKIISIHWPSGRHTQPLSPLNVQHFHICCKSFLLIRRHRDGSGGGKMMEKLFHLLWLTEIEGKRESISMSIGVLSFSPLFFGDYEIREKKLFFPSSQKLPQLSLRLDYNELSNSRTQPENETTNWLASQHSWSSFIFPHTCDRHQPKISRELVHKEQLEMFFVAWK